MLPNEAWTLRLVSAGFGILTLLRVVLLGVELRSPAARAPPGRRRDVELAVFLGCFVVELDREQWRIVSE